MGGKSQGSARTPHEAPDSLRSSQRLRAIGLISLGPIKGPANKWKSTYFDNTPIQNANGVDDNDESSFNFKNTEIAYTLGTQDQMPLQGFEMSEREVSVGAEIKNVTPVTRTVIDPDVTRLRITCGVSALFSQNDNGDTEGTSVSLEILINGQSRTVKNISGKSSSRFYRSYIIDNLPPKPFTITVKRLTDDSKSQRLQNGTHWVSYTEIIDTKLSYPNMALIGIKTDSRYNPNFPNVNLLLYGRLVKVPSTYNPETRTYAPGIWRGDWKEEWTDNPAWIFYDLVTNSLAGLGKRIGEYGLDKFQLYQIAKYCDELVDDGYGGKEPRMVSNLWITEQRDAYNVLSDMASVFRSIAVWNGTQFSAIQDRTSDPVCLYTQSNVVDGKFSRQFAAGKTIFTAVEVEYADERNFYQKAVEYVADDLMIARYGYNVKKITAYGCTSRGQAHRYGKWVLETSRLEQCTITFVVGRQGLLHLPGDIIEIADNDFAGKTLGGRVVAISGKKVTLDQPVEITGNSYLSYLNDEMQLVQIKIINADNTNKSVVTLETNPVGLNVMDDWVLKTPQVSTQLYRALGITENDDGSYTITALQHEPQKEAIVDGSASFVPVVSTMHNGLTKVTNADVVYSADGIKLTWSVPTTDTLLTYEVRLYRNGKVFKTYLNLKNPEISFEGLPDGSYTAEIRAKNQSGQLSDPVTRSFEINLNIPRFVTKSLLFAIELDWDLPKTFTPGFSTEIWRSNTNDISTAVKVATLPYPQSNYVINGVPLSTGYYFYLRGVDKQGNKGEFTEAVFGEADHNPDNLLNAIEGKITKSHLGQELINSLKNDVDSAVSEEAKARITAVNNALQQINNQAATAGTAIQKLEKADKDQAETIKTVTAKAESALSGITAVRQAQANSDKANAQQITALTARMGTAESSIANIRTAKADKSEVAGIAQQSLRATWQADAQAKADKAKTDAVAQSKAEIDVVSRAVAGVNSKLLATHTIKTQVVAGGRTAIAGIALGASSDGKTAESSVIVMADKFGIVANANDSNVKQVFSVANGQVGIRGDLVVAGSVTRDKLSSGGGGNLLYNPILANNAHGFYENRGNGNLETGGVTRISRYVSNSVVNDLLPTENVLVTEVYASSSLNKNDRWWSPLIANVKVTKGRRYCFSAHTHAWRCGAQLLVEEMTSSWGFVRTIKSGALIGAQGIGNQSGSFDGKSIDSGTRQHIFFTAPESGHVSLHVRLKFTGYWEASCMIARLMLEECTEHATEPSPWQNAGVTEMHGGSIIANTIRGDHIQANQEIRAPRISGGEIDISGNDGILRVGRTGNFLVRASSQNRGLVMNNDQIIVYDDRGNVRVKIGRL
ncbi:MAG: phage tail protein [Haemophilus parainfluenzae]|nr:phage tail protein [Haemophilus parainfluenzae]